jgi:hypothetical protein
MRAFELTFMDGEKRVVHDCTYSRASVRGAWERMLEGADGHKQLQVVRGERRPDLDRLDTADLAVQEAQAADARAKGMGGQPLSMPDALAIACSCMAGEARLTARIAGPEEREILLRMAEAFRNPERVAAFLGQ